MKWIHLETYGPIVNGQTQKLWKVGKEGEGGKIPVFDSRNKDV